MSCATCVRPPAESTIEVRDWLAENGNPCQDVRRAKRHQFAIRVYLIAIFLGKGLRQKNAVRKRQKGDRHRGRRERRDIRPLERWYRQTRDTRRHLADQRYPVAVEVEGEGGDNRHRADGQCPRYARQPARQLSLIHI